MNATTLNTREKCIWLLASCLIFGCALALKSSFATVSIAAHQHDTTAAEHDASPSHAHTNHKGHQHSLEEDRLLHGKPGSQLRLTSLPVYRMAVNAQKEVTLTLDTTGLLGTMHVTLRPSDSLAIVNGNTEHTIELVGQTEVSLPVSVISNEDGEHYLHVVTRIVDGYGMETSRALATAFMVGTQVVSPNKYKMQQKVSMDKATVMLKAKEVIY